MRASTGRTFLSIGVDPDVLRRLDRLAHRHTVSRSELARRGIDCILDALEDADDELDDEILAERQLAARVVRAS